MSGVVAPCIERVIVFRCFQSLDVAFKANDDVECGEFCEPTTNGGGGVSSWEFRTIEKWKQKRNLRDFPIFIRGWGTTITNWWERKRKKIKTYNYVDWKRGLHFVTVYLAHFVHLGHLWNYVWWHRVQCSLPWCSAAEEHRPMLSASKRFHPVALIHVAPNRVHGQIGWIFPIPTFHLEIGNWKEKLIFVVERNSNVWKWFVCIDKPRNVCDQTHGYELWILRHSVSFACSHTHKYTLTPRIIYTGHCVIVVIITLCIYRFSIHYSCDTMSLFVMCLLIELFRVELLFCSMCVNVCVCVRFNRLHLSPH